MRITARRGAGPRSAGAVPTPHDSTPAAGARYGPAPVTSPYQLFERAERIELLSARIYGALARLFEDGDARALFSRLEAEEEQHALRVQLLAAHYRRDPKLPIAAGAPELDRCIAEATQALADVEAGRWPRRLAEVRRRLAVLEGRLAGAHAELLAAGAPPALRDFFLSLSAQDAEHARLLGELAIGADGREERDADLLGVAGALDRRARGEGAAAARAPVQAERGAGRDGRELHRKDEVEPRRRGVRDRE